MAQILLVEDDRLTQRLAASALLSHGHAVEVAGDAETAWMMIERRRPDLVLMDRTLPGSDGLSLTRRIKSEACTAAIIVLAFSAHGSLDDDTMARDAGSDGFVPKPTDPLQLLRHVTWHLAAQRRSTEPFDDGGSLRSR